MARRSPLPRILLALSLITAARAAYILSDCDEAAPNPDPVPQQTPPFVPQIPGSDPPGFGRTFGNVGEGNTCDGEREFECTMPFYCDPTTSACQLRLPLGYPCDASLRIQICGDRRATEMSDSRFRQDIPPAPGATCATLPDGSAKCVPLLAVGAACGDAASGACGNYGFQFASECDAGICARLPSPSDGEPGVGRGELATCTGDGECENERECRPAVDGRMRCLRVSPLGFSCGGRSGRISDSICAEGTRCDASTNMCVDNGRTFAIGEVCSVVNDSPGRPVACDSGENDTNALCPFYQDEDFNDLESSCEIDTTGKSCSDSSECANGGVAKFVCDSGLCATSRSTDGVTGKGLFGTCSTNDECLGLLSNNQILPTRCMTAGDGSNRCMQERYLGESCAPTDGLATAFVCSVGTKCHGPSLTCVHDAAPVATGEACARTQFDQFAVCTNGSGCGEGVGSDGFRRCE